MGECECDGRRHLDNRRSDGNEQWGTRASGGAMDDRSVAKKVNGGGQHVLAGGAAEYSPQSHPTVVMSSAEADNAPRDRRVTGCYRLTQ